MWTISKAMMKNFGNLHSLQDQEEEFSVDNSLDGEQSVQSSTTSTVEAYWYAAKTKDTLSRSRSGMTYAPLTESHGEDVLTSFLADSLAKTSRVVERVKELKEPDLAYGGKWRELSERYDLDTSSWRTAHSLFPVALDWSSLTLPRWGMMRGGELWELTTQVLPTSEKESGSWPTRRKKEATKVWRTPTASEPGVKIENLVPSEGGSIGGNNRHYDKNTGRLVQVGLSLQVMVEEEKGHWPTPRARDFRDSIGDKLPPSRIKDKGKDTLAQRIVRERLERTGYWPTPMASDNRDRGVLSDPTVQDRVMRGKQVTLSNLVVEKRGGGTLNPTWVAWLMGWPIGWTDSKPLETVKYQEWLNLHGKS